VGNCGDLDVTALLGIPRITRCVVRCGRCCG
jgi:hypothetical protein